jgi:segregation and condensation protein B
MTLDKKIDPVRDRPEEQVNGAGEGSSHTSSLRNRQRASISNGIEVILFTKGEPIAVKKLANFLGVSTEDINEALGVLEQKLSDRGLTLVYKDDEVMLGTKSDFSSLLEKLHKEELNKELSKASVETISIILYKNGAIRSEIDWIRGVNSSFILRNLLIRGLVEKITDPNDNRRFIYKPTFDLFSYLGISKIEELPNYAEIKAQITKRQDDLNSN